MTCIGCLIVSMICHFAFSCFIALLQSDGKQCMIKSQILCPFLHFNVQFAFKSSFSAYFQSWVVTVTLPTLAFEAVSVLYAQSM